ncbi:DNA transposition protein [Prevotella sp. HMSC069G02]|nr:DNA transposition protein [Prevotella sp. HMSC069G02]
MSKLTNNEKSQIRENLKQYVAKFPSQNKAAQSLTGISSATLSTLLQGKWENISDDMWRNLASQLGTGTGGDWQVVETKAWQEMTLVMQDAQSSRNVTWVVGEAGCGKTTTARLYATEHGEVFYILCSEDMKKSDFVREIARRIGQRTEGYSIRELLDRIIDDLIQMEAPLLLFDEADKLPERVFHYFIDLYNRLEDKCGIVFFSTSYIKRRMTMGLRYNKCGYNEIHSRIGRKFYELERTAPHDVYAVCMANGVTDKGRISEVIKDSEAYEFDLRRVKKSIHRVKVMGVRTAVK